MLQLINSMVPNKELHDGSKTIFLFIATHKRHWSVNMTPKSFLRPNPTFVSIKPKGLKIEKLLFSFNQRNNLRVLLRQLELGYARITHQDTPYVHKLPHNGLLNFQAVIRDPANSDKSQKFKSLKSQGLNCNRTELRTKYQHNHFL